MQAWIKRFCPQTLDGLILLGLTDLWLVYRHIFLSPKPVINHIGYLQLPVMFQFFPMIRPLPRAGYSPWWFLDERRTRIHHPRPDFATDSGCSCRRLEGWHFKKSFILGSSVLYTWRFPKIGVSLFFPWNKPLLGYPRSWKPPYTFWLFSYTWNKVALGSVGMQKSIVRSPKSQHQNNPKPRNVHFEIHINTTNYAHQL